MSDEASPRPWKRDGWTILDAGGRYIVSVNVSAAPPFADDSKVATLIVRAVNAHDALVAVLREAEWEGADIIAGLDYRCCPICLGLRSEPTDMHPSQRVSRCVGHAPGCKLAAALALAEGREP